MPKQKMRWGCVLWYLPCSVYLDASSA